MEDKLDGWEGDWKMEVMKNMTAREVVNLIEWLKAKNFSSDDIVDCIETVLGKKAGPEKENKGVNKLSENSL